MLSIVCTITAIVIAVMVLIAIHEYAHYLAAKFFSIRILQFSLGFGPVVATWHNRLHVPFLIRAFPIGGFVKMLNTREAPVDAADYPYAFDQRPIWQRALVVAAGPIANILIALAGFWLVLCLGLPLPAAIVADVPAATPAAEAGVPKGSTMTAVDGKPVQTWVDATLLIMQRLGDTGTMQLDVLTEGKPRQFSLALAAWNIQGKKPDPLRALGLLPPKPPLDDAERIVLQYSAPAAVVPALTMAWRYTVFNATILYRLVVGKISLHMLGGPLSLLDLASQSFYSGMVKFLSFLAYLSLLLGIVNLLPIPGLDGGHLLYLGYEKLFGQPVSIAVEVLFYRLAYIAMVVLIIQMCLNDLHRYLA